MAGHPGGQAADLRTAHEGMDRGWFASPVGWMAAAGDGEFRVALRTGLVTGVGTPLYAGAGVVEGSDPAPYELVQKLHMLQKRLIEKSEEVVEKDLLIHHKEKLYVELKNILARQPGPEVAEQLSIYQQNLRDKTRQMKAMASELNMYQAQVNEYKYEVERLTRELQDVKRKYYEQKRRDQLAREQRRLLLLIRLHAFRLPRRRRAALCRDRRQMQSRERHRRHAGHRFILLP